MPRFAGPTILLALVGLGVEVGACGRSDLFSYRHADGGGPIAITADGGGGAGGFGSAGRSGKADGGQDAIGRRDGGAPGGQDGGLGGRAGGPGGRGGAGGLVRDGGSGDSVAQDSGIGGGGRDGASGGTGGLDAGAGAGGKAVDGGRGGAGGLVIDGGAAGGVSGSDAGLLDGGGQCDPVLQNCGAGQRCDVPKDGPLVFACVPDLGGRGGQDAICTETGQECIKGATCLQDTDRFGNPVGPPRCTLFCDTAANCPPGGRCLMTAITDTTSSNIVGICLP